MDKATIRKRVIDFMRDHHTSDIEELHNEISCDVGLLIEVIDELSTDGIIKEVFGWEESK